MVDAKIRVENLNLWFGPTQILKQINISVSEKQVTAIMGPSGCGKSTLLRTLNRMNDLIENCRREGKIYLDNTDILSPVVDIYELRKRVGMVFQQPNPFPMSVFDNVAYGMRIHGIHNRKIISENVERALLDANLWEEVGDKLRKSAMELSGGQQQRLCIARALAIQPEVLLLDEPASALDPISSAKLEALIEKLKNNYSIIIVTHNLQQASRVSQWTAFMMLGELVECGPTAQIFTAPRDSRTENYLRGKFG